MPHGFSSRSITSWTQQVIMDFMLSVYYLWLSAVAFWQGPAIAWKLTYYSFKRYKNAVLMSRLAHPGTEFVTRRNWKSVLELKASSRNWIKSRFLDSMLVEICAVPELKVSTQELKVSSWELEVSSTNEICYTVSKSIFLNRCTSCFVFISEIAGPCWRKGGFYLAFIAYNCFYFNIMISSYNNQPKRRVH